MTDSSAAPGDPPRADAPRPLPAGWLSRWPWLTFVGPFVVYMLVGSLEPTPPPEPAPAAAIEGAEGADADDPLAGLSPEDAVAPEAGWIPKLPYRYYPLVYTAKIVLTLAAMVLVWPGYRTFPCRVSGLAIAVGIVGGVLWIVLAKLPVGTALEAVGLDRFLETGRRSAFDPLRYMADNPALAYAFLALRLAGLAIVVPIIEEFFLRGFLMRFVVHDQWHQVPFGTATPLALATGTIVPMLMHPPVELVAVAVWFSLVSWLMVRTRNIWDCVAAHAVTNAMLGAYVLWSGDWWLM